MSLDVTLTMKIEQEDITKVMIYDADGHQRELTRAEWAAAFPDFILVDDHPAYEEVYDRNITHNLGKMAAAAGIYEAVWEPDENGMTTARQLIEPLRAGIERLKADPDHFKQFSASNGWGTYDQFIPWLVDYLNACEQYPDADVQVSR